MAADIAIKTALDLLMLPMRVRTVRQEPLPSGIDQLLRVLSGDEALIEEMVRTTGRSADTLQDAAAFYAEQILLYPEADLYRNLGSPPGTTGQELRHRMALLMTWLHPDRGGSTARQALASRVMDAWHTLSNDDRRAVYDQHLSISRHTMLETAVQPPGPGGRPYGRPYTVPTASKRRRFFERFKAFMLGHRPPLA